MVARVAVVADGLEIRHRFKKRQIPWTDIDRITLVEESGTAQTYASSQPGAVRLGRVVALLKDGEVILLRRSFSQFVGPDKGLRRWAKDLRRRLDDARPEKGE